MKRFILTCAMAVAVGAWTAAAKDGLKIGDAAPKLQTGKFVQGEAVKGFETGKVYVVEFWATWCGPCRASIPHVNELSKKFADKGLVVIGQNCWEEDESGVAAFIKKMGDKMTYRVALDDKSKEEKGAMAKTWMEAAGQDGIPCAFVVGKDGKIAWIGHPMQGMDKVVEDVIAGTFDPSKAAKMSEERDAMQEKLMGISQKLQEAMMAKEWDEALVQVDELRKALGEDDMAKGLDMLAMQIQTQKGDFKAAYASAEKAMKTFDDEPEALNAIAWMIATEKAFEKDRNLALAEKAAARAAELTKNDSGAILDTLARINFMQGKKDKAIELQTKAIDKEDVEEQKDELKKTLESYKAGKLPPAPTMDEAGEGATIEAK